MPGVLPAWAGGSAALPAMPLCQHGWPCAAVAAVSSNPVAEGMRTGGLSPVEVVLSSGDARTCYYLHWLCALARRAEVTAISGALLSWPSAAASRLRPVSVAKPPCQPVFVAGRVLRGDATCRVAEAGRQLGRPAGILPSYPCCCRRVQQDVLLPLCRPSRERCLILQTSLAPTWCWL
jgi:hypothetical protein